MILYLAKNNFILNIMFEDLQKTWLTLLKYTLKQLSMMLQCLINSREGKQKEIRGHAFVTQAINDFSCCSSQRSLSSPDRIFSYDGFNRVLFILIQYFFFFLGGGGFKLSFVILLNLFSKQQLLIRLI